VSSPSQPPAPKIPRFETVDEMLRVAVVSEVRAKHAVGGLKLEDVAREIAGRPHVLLDGAVATVSERSVFRYWAAFRSLGWEGLRTRRHPNRPVGAALPPGLVDFLVAERKLDRYASLPELLRRAVAKQVLAADQAVDRTTVWRFFKASGLPVRRVPGKAEVDARRWAYPHRMMMVLCDGKHFRAGARKLRRVALFFLDDATRRGLTVVVGTSESARLFLRGLRKLVLRVGLCDVLYLDKGPGFNCADTHDACLQLEICFIHGRAAYPEGHGKIEKFNQTASTFVLRGLTAPEVDPECAALELRLEHFLDRQYNLKVHESLDGLTPLARWDADTRALRFPESEQVLDDKLVVTESRAVSNDNIVPVGGVDYEVPRGHAETRIDVRRNLVSGALFVQHDGHLVQLHPVDLAANAIALRARPKAPAPDDDEGCPRTAASIAFERDFGPVLGPDGGCLPPNPKPGDDP
jgi:transposase InsO family protein